MERFRCRTLDELRSARSLSEEAVYTHGLESLLRTLLGESAWARLMDGGARFAFLSQVNRWKPHWRYDPKNPPEPEARRFLAGIHEVWNWLEHNV